MRFELKAINRSSKSGGSGSVGKGVFVGGTGVTVGDGNGVFVGIIVGSSEISVNNNVGVAEAGSSRDGAGDTSADDAVTVGVDVELEKIDNPLNQVGLRSRITIATTKIPPTPKNMKSQGDRRVGSDGNTAGSAP